MPVSPAQIYRALRQTLPRVVGPVYREYIFETGVVLPLEMDLEAGAEYITEEIVSEFGQADWIGDTVDDVPMVGVGVDEDLNPVFMAAAGYQFSFKSTRSLRFANRLAQITEKKQRLARRAIAQRLHKFFAIGDVRIKQTGFLNNAAVPVRASTFDATAETGAAGADALKDFLIESYFYLYREQNGYAAMPDTMMLSPRLYELGVTLQVRDTGDTVIDNVRRALSSGGAGDDSPVSIISAPECSASYLEANGVKPQGTGEDRLVVYERDPDVVTGHCEPIGLIPPEFLTHLNGNVFANFKCASPAHWSQPQRGQYLDIPAVA